jgi:hypothetical protein
MKQIAGQSVAAIILAAAVYSLACVAVWVNSTYAYVPMPDAQWLALLCTALALAVATSYGLRLIARHAVAVTSVFTATVTAAAMFSGNIAQGSALESLLEALGAPMYLWLAFGWIVTIGVMVWACLEAAVRMAGQSQADAGRSEDS